MKAAVVAFRLAIRTAAMARRLHQPWSMLDWSLILFALSFVATLLGYASLAAAAAALAQGLLFTLLAVVVLGVLGALLGGCMP